MLHIFFLIFFHSKLPEVKMLGQSIPRFSLWNIVLIELPSIGVWEVSTLYPVSNIELILFILITQVGNILGASVYYTNKQNLGFFFPLRTVLKFFILFKSYVMLLFHVEQEAMRKVDEKGI